MWSNFSADLRTTSCHIWILERVSPKEMTLYHKHTHKESNMLTEIPLGMAKGWMHTFVDGTRLKLLKTFWYLVWLNCDVCTFPCCLLPSFVAENCQKFSLYLPLVHSGAVPMSHGNLGLSVCLPFRVCLSGLLESCLTSSVCLSSCVCCLPTM